MGSIRREGHQWDEDHWRRKIHRRVDATCEGRNALPVERPGKDSLPVRGRAAMADGEVAPLLPLCDAASNRRVDCRGGGGPLGHRSRRRSHGGGGLLRLPSVLGHWSAAATAIGAVADVGVGGGTVAAVAI
jgi:hypothetical protein